MINFIIFHVTLNKIGPILDDVVDVVHCGAAFR